MTNRSRARWSLAVALAAHAIVIAWTRYRTPPSPVAPLRATEIEIVLEPPPAIAAPPAPIEAPRAAPEPDAVATRVPSRSSPYPTSPAASPSATPEASAAPATSAEVAGDGSWTFSPTRPSAPSGGASAAPDAAGALSRATAVGVGVVLAEAQRKAEDRERRPLIFTGRDMDLGMVPGGQYVSLTRDRVRNSLVPMQGHALLEFWTDKRGLVARVRVLDASSDQRAWDDAADALAEDAHTAFPLKVPDNADGLIVTLDVTSVLKTLSGASPSQNPFAKAFNAIQDPVDTVLDSKAVAQRLVAAKVVHVEAF